jgi:serine/threonine protein phosphatase PrpC
MILILEDQGEREYMEDRLAYEINIVPGFDYYAVFDGHGGEDVASYLKTHLGPVIKDTLTKILTTYKTNVTIAHIIDVLHTSFEKINQQIPTCIALNTGSTAVVVLKHCQHIWVANCGDSRAIMNNGINSSIELSSDHKPNRDDEQARIIRNGGFVAKAYPGDVFRVNGVLAVSRSIGDLMLQPHVTWKPEIKYFQKSKSNGYMFLATDGIWDVLSNNEVVDIVNKCILHGKYQHIGKEIVSLARKRGSSDNITFLITPL